jgi:hypothetical protein
MSKQQVSHLSRIRIKSRQIVEEWRIEQISMFNYRVESQATKNLCYAVFNDGKTKFCECHDNGRTHRSCHHIMGVDLLKYGIIKEDDLV